MNELLSQPGRECTLEESFMEIVGIYYIYTRMLGGVKDPDVVLSEFRIGKKKR